MTVYYLSFASETKFLGACVVTSESAESAPIVAAMRGLNPGGECLIFELPPEVPESETLPRNRLLSDTELREFGLKSCREWEEEEKSNVP